MTNSPVGEPGSKPEAVASASLKKAADEVDRAITRLRQGLDDGSLPPNKTRVLIAHWEKVAAQMRSEDDSAAGG